jgi:hypothetical protein
MHTPYCPSLKTVITASATEGGPSLFEALSLKRFRHFIETSDWDKALLQKEKWVNRCCWLILGLSLLYTSPLLVTLLYP